VLFLIPPSETKAKGGGALSISQVALTFGGLNPARDLVYSALHDLCLNSVAAAKVLGLSAKQLGEIQANLDVQDAPVMRALDRYQGTLFDGIHNRGLKGTPTEHNQLPAMAVARAKQNVFIQSSLFGLIPATDLIPDYRLSAGTRLPALRERSLTLAKVWAEAHLPIWRRLVGSPIIDMRSKAYAELAPIPSDLESYALEVELEKPDGSRERLNHFNKKAKGQLLNAVLTAVDEPRTLDDLAACAESKGMRLEVVGNQLTLVTFA
jgi:cytoplasmic iron level regulating protein YaaA (DUF328/UPF0246 family)